MPSENKTPNIELNQWQGNEHPKREDFVEDNSKIDAAIKETNNKRVTHEAETMPHSFIGSDGKTYRWGLGQQGGLYGFLYEEVVE
ncbi:hypothetical protein SAMN05660297_02736 [Natronincola peptidivorans]|uniref:Uncharacterized protein n=1 Tax=Natronincola peptidivorans TaxID=426128 RepID=A0A1I0FBD7_9FIRM|nr:hypothetical protein [Natronincola peptidivorans]SET55267.1 hypothetical protein SAMN05660297_02736 [Natronincola peptidivorans]